MHTHHYIIPTSRAEYVNGECTTCGGVRTFANDVQAAIPPGEISVKRVNYGDLADRMFYALEIVAEQNGYGIDRPGETGERFVGSLYEVTGADGLYEGAHDCSLDELRDRFPSATIVRREYPSGKVYDAEPETLAAA